MKCLSVSQPFAQLIAQGKKKIELRSWNTKFRGEFLIHAPIKIRTWDMHRLKISRKEIVTGAIIGKAEIYDVKKYETKADLKRDYKLHFLSSMQQQQFKTKNSKKYGFLIKNPKMFRIPIPCKGKLGLFQVRIPDTKISDDAITTDIIDEEYRYQWIGHH